MKPVSRTQKEVYQLWLQALRSGKYQQGQERLCRPTMADRQRFCCLGVLQDLAVRDGGAAWNTPSGAQYSDEAPQQQILDFMGIDDDMVAMLISMNDYEGHTFYQIADVIETVIMPAVCE